MSLGLIYSTNKVAKVNVTSCVLSPAAARREGPQICTRCSSANRSYQVSKQWAFEEQSIYLIISFLHVMHFIYIVLDAETLSLSHTHTCCQKLQKPELQLHITWFSVLCGNVYFKIVERTRTWWKKIVWGSCMRSPRKFCYQNASNMFLNVGELSLWAEHKISWLLDDTYWFVVWHGIWAIIVLLTNESFSCALECFCFQP